MITVFNKKWCTIMVDLESKILTESWIGFISHEQFKEGIDVIVDCFKKYDLQAILADAKHMQLLSEEDVDYAVSRMPERVCEGLKYMAFVMPLNEMTCIPINEFKAKFDSNMIRHFDTKEEAWAWLEGKLSVVD